MPSAPLLSARLPVLGVGLAIALALGAAITGPAAGGRSEPPPSVVVTQRTLTFEDRADGAVLVREAGREVAVFEGEQGFVRGTLRGLARSRRIQGLSPTTPFLLSAWADGRLTLDDMATNQRVELEAFGSTNAAVFATLLPGLGK